MEGVFDNYNKKPRIQVIKGDFIDRLHGRTTISFLFFILILITFKQAIYSNILCWYPTYLNDAQGGYLTQFCWINSTYLYPDDFDSENYASSNHKQISVPYYQFITFILIGQILMFYIPSLIWKILASNSNGYMNKLLDISSATFKGTNAATEEFLKTFKPLTSKYKVESVDSSESTSLNNEKTLETINENVSLSHRQTSRMSSKIKSNKSYIDRNIKQKLVSALNPLKGVKGLTIKYFLLKFLNLSNAIGQIFLLNIIFGGQFLNYGLKYAMKLWNAQNPLLLTREFPIFTLCDFFVHQPNRKIHEHTVQCILTMNVLLEKFYVCIWFWLVMLSIVTLWNLISWIYEIIFSTRAQFLYKYLNIQSQMYQQGRDGGLLIYNNNDNDRVDDEKKKLMSLQSNLSKPEDVDIQNFQNKYLGTDGLVMLLIIKSAAGDVAFIELLGVLWKDFNSEKIIIESKNDV
jgi:hypothetical protein